MKKEMREEISSISFIASIIFTFINGDLVNVNKLEMLRVEISIQ